MANVAGGAAISAAFPRTLLAEGGDNAKPACAAKPETQPVEGAAEVNGFLVVAPSTVAVNEEFSLGIKVLGARRLVLDNWPRPFPSQPGPFNVSAYGSIYMDNVPLRWNGRVRIGAEGGFRGPDGFCFKDCRGIDPNDRRPIVRLPSFRFSEPGIKRVAVVDPATGIAADSNPIEVVAQAPSERLYWGDLHCHTILSDGLRCPEEVCAFAQREAFLDVFSLSDHSEYLTRRQWEYITGVVNDGNDPGKFVTLIGFEWTNHQLGHRNVYFPGDAGPLVRCSHREEGKLARLYEIARQEGALVVPHHTANLGMGTDWSLGHDEEVERLVEIYSVWGNSERPAAAGNTRPVRHQGGEAAGRHVLDALRRGYKLGFIAGGDVHDGRPGDNLMRFQKLSKTNRLFWGQGLMGIWTRELTRRGVFDALWNRRVFATTNVRTALRFSVCGQPMGGTTRSTGTRPVELWVAGQSPLARIEIVRNGDTIASLQTNDSDAVFNYKDAETSKSDWYYARVTHENGEMAWSSPVWIEAK